MPRVYAALYLLYMDQGSKRTFSSQLMVSYGSAGKLSSYLTRATLYSIERKAGSCKYNGKHLRLVKIYYKLIRVPVVMIKLLMR